MGVLILDGKEHKEKEATPSKIVEHQFDNDDESDVIHPTEIAEAMRELDKDEPEKEGRFTSIDKSARISKAEKDGYMGLGALINYDFLSEDAQYIIRSGLRLSLSIDGKSRKEKIELARGIKDHESKSGFIDKLGGVFAGKGGGV